MGSKREFKVWFPGSIESVSYEPATYAPDVREGWCVEVRAMVKAEGGELIPNDFTFLDANYLHSSHLVEIARFVSDAHWDLQSITLQGVTKSPAVAQQLQQLQQIERLLEPISTRGVVGGPCGTNFCDGVARWIPISEGNRGSTVYRCTECCDRVAREHGGE